MSNKLVMKTPVSCAKCKSTILQAIAKLEGEELSNYIGIDEVSIDAKKGTVTVIGDVDPTKVVKNLKKARKHVKIETLGPHKKEEPCKKKGEEKEKKNINPAPVVLPYCCDRCAYGENPLVIAEEPRPSCNIQ